MSETDCIEQSTVVLSTSMKPPDSRTVKALATSDPDSATPESAMVPARTLLRGLRLLELVAAGADVTVTDLAKGAHLDKGTTSRILTSLRKAGYVRQDPDTKRYGLSGKVLWFAQAYTAPLDLRRIARPHLDQLRHRVNETVYLGLLESDHIVFVDKLETAEAVRVVSPIGTTEDVQFSPMGHAIFAALPPDQRPEFSDAPRFRRHSAELDLNGYVVDDEESAAHVTSIAAPILGPDNRPVAALSCVGPSFRMAGRIADIGVLCRDAAAAIGTELGQTLQD